MTELKYALRKESVSPHGRQYPAIVDERIAEQFVSGAVRARADERVEFEVINQSIGQCAVIVG